MCILLIYSGNQYYNKVYLTVILPFDNGLTKSIPMR